MFNFVGDMCRHIIINKLKIHHKTPINCYEKNYSYHRSRYGCSCIHKL